MNQILVFLFLALILYLLIRSSKNRLSGFRSVSETADAVVREYASHTAFRTDAAKLAVTGFVVSNVSEMTQRSGCLRMLTLGIFALIWRPPSHIIVTYHRN